MAVRIEARAEPIPGYRLIERLGGGGFGEVWKCEAPGGLHKAIKFVYGNLGNASEDTHRAEQELKALSRVKTVRHPYILSLERYDIIDTQLLIVMELADRNLWDRFKECRTQGLPGIPRDELLGYMEETAEALDLMNNEYQLQHLDIKPQNLFLVHNHVKVADFGLVKAMEGMQASVTGGVTPVYAAPETFDGWVSRFSDQYSLGIVYQEMLTGQRPFNGNNVRQLVLQHLQAAPCLTPLPAHDRPLIARALAKSPDERHPSCLDLARALRNAGSHAAPEGRPQSSPVFCLPPVAPSALEKERSESGGKEAASASTPVSEVTTPIRRRSGEVPIVGIPPPSRPPSTPADAACATQVVPFSAPRAAPVEVEGDGVLFPALVIGLGHVGLSILARLRQQMQIRLDRKADVSTLRLLLLDTDPEVVRLATRGPSSSRLPEPSILLAPLNRPSHYLKPREGKVRFDTWIPQRMLYRIPRSQVTTGVRALGRLAFCDHYRVIVRRLQNELEAMLQPDALEEAAAESGLGVRSNRPRVYIVTSLSGGTGSGMFLDVAYTVRALLRQMGYAHPEVVGLFLAPSVEPGKTRVLPLGNTCAALRELLHFGQAESLFTARYQEREAPVQDGQPPFQRTFFLPLPEDADEQGQITLAQTAGQLLWRELCSPLGRALDVGRSSVPPPPAEERPLCYHSFGIYQLRWPRQMIHKAVARELCQRLVGRWMSKDSKPILESVQSWVQEQRTQQELDAPHFLTQLSEGCRDALGQAPEDAFVTVIATVEASARQSAQPAAGAAKPSSSAALPKVRVPDLRWGATALEALSELLGKTDETSPDSTGKITVLLYEASERLIQSWGQKLAELPVQLIEEPGLRLAGAEEAVRLLSDAMEQMLQHNEPLARELTQRVRELQMQVQTLIATGNLPAGRQEASFFRRGSPDGKGRGPDLAEMLRGLAKTRFQLQVMNRLLAALVTLRGHLADEMREIGYCRVRLAELRHTFGSPAEALIGTSSLGRLPALEQPLFPVGCKSLKETVEHLITTLDTPDRALELDRRMEAVLRKQFRALVNVCLSPANVLKNVEPAMLQTAEDFVSEFLPKIDVAELFLEHHGSDEEATAQLVRFYREAAPRMVSGSSSDEETSSEVCVLATPPGAAGERIRGLVQKALPDVRWLVVSSNDDVVFYRERTYLPLESLPQLGPAAQDAYRQMTAVENFTPHSRTDVAW